ncbi:MAG: N-acetyltransferase [Planctomycetota bacterium]|nr:MAG: N-acetyltransferase [Planctomycetota bacterium]
MTGELVLRDVTEADLPVFFEHQKDPEANRMAAFPARDRGAFTAHWARIRNDATVVVKTVLCDGQVAGSVVSFEQSGQRLVGYWIGREFWGRGVATRALAAFLRCLPVRPLHARVASHNVASLRVLEKCGFTRVGLDRALSSSGGEVVEEFVLELRARA